MYGHPGRVLRNHDVTFSQDDPSDKQFKGYIRVTLNITRPIRVASSDFSMALSSSSPDATESSPESPHSPASGSASSYVRTPSLQFSVLSPQAAALGPPVQCFRAPCAVLLGIARMVISDFNCFVFA